MVEKDLAAQLGMSKTPVHQAVVRLQNEGFLEVHSRRGIEVLRLSAAEMRETYQVLTALEGSAAVLLAQAGKHEVFDRMEEATAEMDAALEAGDLQAWARADDRFHRQISAGGGNHRLFQLATNLYDLSQWARISTLVHRAQLPTGSSEAHRAIIAALREGDGQRARLLVEGHHVSTAPLIIAALERP